MKTIFVLAISFCFAASASAESPAPTFGLGDQCETGQCVVATNSSFGLVDRVRTRTRTVVRRAPVAQCVEVQAAPVYVEQLVPVTTMVQRWFPSISVSRRLAVSRLDVFSFSNGFESSIAFDNDGKRAVEARTNGNECRWEWVK